MNGVNWEPIRKSNKGDFKKNPFKRNKESKRHISEMRKMKAKMKGY